MCIYCLLQDMDGRVSPTSEFRICHLVIKADFSSKSRFKYIVKALYNNRNEVCEKYACSENDMEKDH